jgi:hypothetical protein
MLGVLEAMCYRPEHVERWEPAGRTAPFRAKFEDLPDGRD